MVRVVFETGPTLLVFSCEICGYLILRERKRKTSDNSNSRIKQNKDPIRC